MKKILFTVIFAIGTMVSAQSGFSTWEDFAKHRYTDLKSISYTLEYTVHYKSGNEAKMSAIVWADSTDFFYNEDNEHLVHVREDTIWFIQNSYENITYGPESGKLGISDFRPYYYIRDQYTRGLAYYAIFNFMPGYTKLLCSLENIIDTVIDGTFYSIMSFTQQISWVYNKETGKNDIPIVDTLRFYCNAKTYWVDKVIVTNSNNKGKKEIFDFKNIQSIPRERMDFSEYDINDRRYKDYAKYDFTVKAAPSCFVTKSNDDTVLSADILNFPLVNTAKDTVHLEDTREWILLDMWDYGCRACVEFWVELQKEKDSLGYRRLEKEGVNIFCINKNGGVSQQFVDYTKRFQFSDIAYSSRGIPFIVRMNPTYYLFAPNRDLVYQGHTKNIIDTLLTLKKGYEMRHKPKSVSKGKGAVITFDKVEHDYGDIEQGGNGKCTFVVKNTGDKPLKLERVKSSCGCTSVDYPQAPIAPGKTGKISVEYNTSEVGSFGKTILVVSNASNETKTTLKIKGRVVKAGRSQIQK